MINLLDIDLKTFQDQIAKSGHQPFPKSGYKSSSRERILSFQKILMDSGIVTTIRKTRGDDIDAACGQLAGDVKDKTKRTLRLIQERKR